MWSRARRSSMERQKTSAMPTIFVRLIRSYPRRWVMDCCIRCAEWEIKKKTISENPSIRYHMSSPWVSDRDKDLFVKVNATAEKRKNYYCRISRSRTSQYSNVMIRHIHHTTLMLAVCRGSSHCNTNLSRVTIATATAHKYNNGVIQCVSIEEKKVQETWFANCACLGALATWKIARTSSVLLFILFYFALLFVLTTFFCVAIIHNVC